MKFSNLGSDKVLNTYVFNAYLFEIFEILSGDWLYWITWGSHNGDPMGTTLLKFIITHGVRKSTCYSVTHCLGPLFQNMKI